MAGFCWVLRLCSRIAGIVTDWPWPSHRGGKGPYPTPRTTLFGPTARSCRVRGHCRWQRHRRRPHRLGERLAPQKKPMRDMPHPSHQLIFRCMFSSFRLQRRQQAKRCLGGPTTLQLLDSVFAVAYHDLSSSRHYPSQRLLHTEGSHTR